MIYLPISFWPLLWFLPLQTAMVFLSVQAFRPLVQAAPLATIVDVG
jgi:hypothetical protein